MVFQVLNEGCIKKLVSQARPSGSCLHTSGSRSHSLLRCSHHPHCAVTLPTVAGMPSSLCPHLAYYGRNAFFSFRTVDRILVLFPSRGMSPGLGCRLGSRGMSPGLGCSCFTRVRSGGAEPPHGCTSPHTSLSAGLSPKYCGSAAGFKRLWLE